MAREIIDLPGSGDGHADLGRALERADRILRLGLAVAWLGTAAAGLPTLVAAESLLRLTLVLAGGALLLDLAPRSAAAAGLAISLLALPEGSALAPWLAVVAAAGTRVALRLGPSGPYLDQVRTLRRQKTRWVAACELHRARAGRLPEVDRAAELERAGDAYERAGRAATQLNALGAGSGAGALAGRTGPALAGTLPARVRDAALRRLEAGGHYDVAPRRRES